MNLVMRDRIATVLVALAVVVYGLRLARLVTGLSPSSAAVLILGLGFLASASAVVPGFVALLAGSRRYLAAASFLGLVALVSGVLTVLHATENTLTILLSATLVLWTAATLRHAGTLHRQDTPIGRRSPFGR